MSNMQKAQATRTITYVPALGSLSAWLECSTGNLYQRYEDDTMTQVAPVFSPTDPCLVTVKVYNTQSAAVAQTITRVTWRLGGTELTFDSNGVSDGVYQGVFRRDTANPAVLKVTGNLAMALGGVSSVLQAEAEIATNSLSAAIVSAHIAVDISQATASSHYLSIMAPKGLTIVTADDKLTLQAKASKGLAEILPTDTSYSVKWEKYDPAAESWATVKASAWSIDVKEKDVDSSALYRASLVQGGETVAIDLETVTDRQDPWWIEPNPTPSDETIIEGSVETVTYTPVLMRPSATLPEGEMVNAGSQLFRFQVIDPSSGMPINGAAAQQGVTSYVVTLNDVVTAGNSVTVIISTDLPNT